MTIKVGSQSPSGVSGGIQEDTHVKTDVAVNEKAQEAPPVPDQSKQLAAQTAKRSEIDLSGQLKYAAMTKELPKTPITGPEVRKQITDPKQMAESRIYTANEKAAFYQRYLEREGTAGLQKLLSESQNWPEESRRAMEEALARSPGAASLATKLKPEEQTQFLNRMLALGAAGDNAAKMFVDAASPATLSNIASKLHDLSNLGVRANPKEIGSGMEFLKRIAERSGEMSQDAQIKFAKSVLDYNIFDKNDLRGNEAFRKQVLQTMFGKMSPDAKNRVFDEMQNSDKALEFAKSIGGENSVPQEVLRGLTDKNTDFLRQMYKKLMNDAKLTGDNKMFSLYERNLKHLEGWMENHFPNFVRK